MVAYKMFLLCYVVCCAICFCYDYEEVDAKSVLVSGLILLLLAKLRRHASHC
jgi:hypothetical protein